MPKRKKPKICKRVGIFYGYCVINSKTLLILTKNKYIMKTKKFRMLFVVAFAALCSNSVFAQFDGYVEQEASPVEVLAYETETGEIRGYGMATSANAQLALNAAKAQATADLQLKIEQYVRYGLNQYMDETSVGDNSSLDEKTRNDVVVAAKGVIEGAVVLKSRRLYNNSKRKYMYEVCMKYDKAGILNAMEAQSERILANRERFERDMQDAWDELDERNGRKTLAEKRAEREARVNEMEQSNRDRENQRVIDQENARGRNAVELENARNRNAMDEAEREEARRDREAVRRAATQNRGPRRRVVIEED